MKTATGKTYRIGEMTTRLGVTADTLRYYEKIGLLPKIARNASGIRHYTDKDLSRLNFIRRAQQMNFTLAEIASLLQMREAPQKAKKQIRELTARKLAEVEARLDELQTLRKELKLLINLCVASGKSCPIIKEIERD
jgi:MerR family transcriptional regulator, copper efflux regulator